MEVQFTTEQEAQLAQLATRTGTDAERLVKNAALLLLDEKNPRSAANHPLQTAANIILDSMKDVPPEIMTTMPKDGASQHDHYIYGWPKKPE